MMFEKKKQTLGAARTEYERQSQKSAATKGNMDELERDGKRASKE